MLAAYTQISAVTKDYADNSKKLSDMQVTITAFTGGDLAEGLKVWNQNLSNDEAALKDKPGDTTLQAKVFKDKTVIADLQNQQKKYEEAVKTIGDDFNGYVAQKEQLAAKVSDLQKQQSNLQQQIQAINSQISQLQKTENTAIANN